MKSPPGRVCYANSFARAGVKNVLVRAIQRTRSIVLSECAYYAALCLFVSLLAVGVLHAETSSGGDESGGDESAVHNGRAGESAFSFVQKPRWELGIGGGAFSGYDYPASSDRNKRAIALPFFIYRTPVFRVGDGGLRAVAIENPRFKLDLSVGGSLNASSEGSSVRQGMPDLDFLFEIGPQLEFRLLDRMLASGSRLRMRFTTELRAVFSSDFRGIDSRGLVIESGVGLNLDNVAGTRMSMLIGLDVTFASEKLHDYFYEVDAEFVTAARPLFDASAGYLETTLFTGVAYRPMASVRIFTGVIQGFFDGASNQRSPLFEVTRQTRLALGIVWTIRSSEQMIDVIDLGSNN